MSKTLVIGTIAGVLLIFALGGLFFWQMQSSQPPATPNSSDFTLSEVEGWQTYRNDEFGFELKLPLSHRLHGAFEGEGLFHIKEGNNVPVFTLLVYGSNSHSVHSTLDWVRDRIISDQEIMINNIAGRRVIFGTTTEQCTLYVFHAARFTYEFTGYESCFEGDFALKILNTFRLTG